MALFKRKPNPKTEVESAPAVPRHIAIIMDGNGRWAQKRGMPRSVGHTFGAKVFKTMARHCGEIGVKYLTVYAFSTENWKRPAEEVSALMKLFKDYLHEALADFLDENIVIRILGDTSVLPDQLRALIERCERETHGNTGLTLSIAMNYGGRLEIVRAVQELASEAQAGKRNPVSITEADIAAHLYTAGQPDPDLIIRPSGEHRTSNFLLWQSAYAEYVFTDVLWPDFKTKDLDAAIEEYRRRDRRYGGSVSDKSKW